MTRKLYCPNLAVGADGVTCVGCGRLTSIATGRLEHRRGLVAVAHPPSLRRRRAAAAPAKPAPVLSPEQLTEIGLQGQLDAEEQAVVDAWWRGFDRARAGLPVVRRVVRRDGEDRYRRTG